MTDNFTADFFEWLDTHNIPREQAAAMLGVDHRSLSTYRSRGLPAKKIPLVKRIMSESAPPSANLQNIVLYPSPEQFNAWTAAFKASDLTNFHDWIYHELDLIAEESRSSDPIESLIERDAANYIKRQEEENPTFEDLDPGSA